MNYNARGLSAVPVSTFSDAITGWEHCAAAGMVIVVIISFLGSLKLRTQVASRSLHPPLPTLCPNQEAVFWPDVFCSVASQLYASPPLSWTPNSEKDWLLGLGN